MNAPTCTPRGAGDFCLNCLLTTLLLLAAVVGSFVYLQIDYGALVSMEALRGIVSFVGEFFPPASEPVFLQKTASGRCKPSPSPPSAPCSLCWADSRWRCRPPGASAARCS